MVNVELRPRLSKASVQDHWACEQVGDWFENDHQYSVDLRSKRISIRDNACDQKVEICPVVNRLHETSNSFDVYFRQLSLVLGDVWCSLVDQPLHPWVEYLLHDSGMPDLVSQRMRVNLIDNELRPRFRNAA